MNFNHSDEIIRELEDLGVDVVSPKSEMEKKIADAMHMFSTFVLVEQSMKCQEILQKHMGKSVGILQGGNDNYEIYRVSIEMNKAANEIDATTELIQEFHDYYPSYVSLLTTNKIQQYMLSMCAQQNIERLGNFMFILSFGPVIGQVRHIDNMVSNKQICLYMSKDCPSTIIYSLKSPKVSNSHELLELWNSETTTPELIQTLLHDKKDTNLSSKWYSKLNCHWTSINTQLKTFGKLYQSVLRPLSITVDPGTTLIAGGNDVHAGPPTHGPRMFAFAIGISDDEETNENNDGEIQYSPALFHIDLCSILFPMMDLDYPNQDSFHAKQYLLQVLVKLVKDFPLEPFEQLISDDKSEIRCWLIELIAVLNIPTKVEILIQKAINSETIFYATEINKLREKQKKRKKYMKQPKKESYQTKVYKERK